MKASESVYLDVRGLKYHCRCWGSPGMTKLFMLHGWMDVSASFQFMVDEFRHPWHVIAPDWRGYGLSSRGGGDCYWIPDLLADLDAILEYFQPAEPVLVAGHSLGGNIAAMYAGIRPQRVARLVNMEGFGLVESRPEDAPRRYLRWLDQIRNGARFRDYGSFEELAERLRANNDRLTQERALFLARHWGVATESGRVALRADPGHKLINPILYRLEEAKACWRAITAPVLWMEGESSQNARALRMSASDRDSRKAYFRDLMTRSIPASGHAIHHDQPELAAAIIEEFLLGNSN